MTRMNREVKDYHPVGQLSDMTLVDGREEQGAVDVIHQRPSWTRSIDFFISCLGGSVGLGNVWKFPFLCYKNGGGAFMIPYFTCMLLASLPLFILEVGIGQYMGAGAYQAWGMVPLFQGLGMTMVVVIFYMNCYYNTILSWTLMYLFHSFSSHLPWDSCEGEWNTERCATDFNQNGSTTSGDNNGSTITTVHPNQTSSGILVDPVTEFWEKKVLDLSEGIEDLGTPKWDLSLCLVLAWVVVYLCICKGIKSSGKVMYFTAPAPYVFMIIILIRNATLEGASDGVRYYLKPNLTKLSDISVWTDAGKQTFFSSCISQGVLLTLGSYNRFKHNFCRDSILFAFVNAFTSLFAGFLVFTILGYMAFQQGKPIEEVAESGPGLVFIAYPKAVSQMPLPQFWSVAFFIMILLLGLDSQFLGVEAVITNFLDYFPLTLRRRKEMFIAVICFINFLIGLIFVCRGGMYVFQLFDFYSSGKTLLLVGFLDVVAITYFFGIRRFFDNMRMMVGSLWMNWLTPYLTVCWTVVTPLLCLTIFALSATSDDNLTYSRPNESIYRYPAWAEAMGWMLTISSVIWIPGVALYRFAKFGFSKKTFRLMLVPLKLKPHQMRPQDKLERRFSDLESHQNSAV